MSTSSLTHDINTHYVTIQGAEVMNLVSQPFYAAVHMSRCSQVMRLSFNAKTINYFRKGNSSMPDKFQIVVNILVYKQWCGGVGELRSLYVWIFIQDGGVFCVCTMSYILNIKTVDGDFITFWFEARVESIFLCYSQSHLFVFLCIIIFMYHYERTESKRIFVCKYQPVML